MALLGSEPVIFSRSATPTAQSITIPSGCTLALVFWNGWANGTDHAVTGFTLDGNAADSSLTGYLTDNTTDSYFAGAFLDPAAGAVDLDYTLDGGLDADPGCIVAYFSDDPGTGWRDIELAFQFGAPQPSGSVTSVSGDKVVVFSWGYSPGSEAHTTPSGWTQEELTDNGDNNFALFSKTATGTTTSFTNEGDTTYNSILIVSVEQAGGQTVAIGLVSETDSALGFTWRKSKAIGLATETDSALAMTRVKRLAIGLAAETDSALAMTFSKAKAIGLATETDEALPVTRSGQVVALGLTTETDSALAMAHAKAKAIGLATEADTALAMTHSKVKAIGLASETDTALSMTHLRKFLIGLATETSAALAMTWRKLKAIGLATETDSALGMTSTGGGGGGIVRRLRMMLLGVR